MIPRRVANLTTRHTPSVLAAALLVVSIWASTVAHVSAQITPVTVTISHRPIIVAMFRGDVNQTALENTYKKYLTPSDYVFNTLGADQAKIDALPGQKLVGGGLVNQMDGIAKQNQGKAQWIVYDLEYYTTMTNASPELVSEYNSYVNSVKSAYDVAHANGMKLVFTPAAADIRKYDSQFAPYCDMVILQIPPTVSDYRGTVQKAVSDIKTANPNAIVIAQLISRTGPQKVNGDPSAIIQSFNSIRDLVDGVHVFIYNSPDPAPILDKFYSGIGVSANGSSSSPNVPPVSPKFPIIVNATSVDRSVMAQIASEVPTSGKQLQLRTNFTGSTGTALSNVNYNIAVSQNGRTVLNASKQTGGKLFETSPLLSSDSLDVNITLLGIGNPGDESSWTGPKGEMVKLLIVPEFGHGLSIVVATVGLSTIIVSVRVFGARRKPSSKDD